MIDRRRRDDRYLEWKVWIFCIAAVLAIGGIYFEQRLLTGAAIVCLVSAMLLRFLPGGGPAEVEDEDAEGEGEVEGDASSGGEVDEAGLGM